MRPSSVWLSGQESAPTPASHSVAVGNRGTPAAKPCHAAIPLVPRTLIRKPHTASKECGKAGGKLGLLNSHLLRSLKKCDNNESHQREETAGDDGLRELWRCESRRPASVRTMWALLVRILGSPETRWSSPPIRNGCPSIRSPKAVRGRRSLTAPRGFPIRHSRHFPRFAAGQRASARIWQHYRRTLSN